MIITYANGTTLEAILVTRHEHTIRVAVRGGDDLLEFKDINGTWVSEDCEPVRIEFEWQRHGHQPEVSEADCICSQDLAARLIHLLLNGDEEECEGVAPPDALQYAAVNGLVV
jgi:hypothetical protein